MKKWISGIITGALALVLLAILFFAISSRITGGAPKIFGYELMTVLSGSMEPSIHTGSIIAIHPSSDTTRFKAGDVITFRSTEDKNILVTHRIKEVKDTGSHVEYITKGDANDAQDPKPVPAGNVVGQYADFTIPYAGFALNFAKSKAGILSLLIIPGALLIAWQIINLWRMFTRLEEEKSTPKEPILQDPTQNV